MKILKFIEEYNSIFMLLAYIGLIICLISAIRYFSYLADIKYREGYEQCTNDTFLYRQIHPEHVGMSQGLRDYLVEHKPSPQTKEDMLKLIKEWEEAHPGF